MRSNHRLFLAASLAAGCLALTACSNDDSYSGRTDSRAVSDNPPAAGGYNNMNQLGAPGSRTGYNQPPQYNSNLPDGAGGSISPANPNGAPATPDYSPNNSGSNPNGYSNDNPNGNLTPTTQPSPMSPIPGSGSGTLEPGVGGRNGGFGGPGTTGNGVPGRIGDGD